MAIDKTGHLAYDHSGHLVFKDQDYMTLIYFQRKSATNPYIYSYHAGGVGTFSYGDQYGTWAHRTLTRSGNQDLYTMSVAGDKYAAALLLGTDGYWYFYYYVSPDPLVSRVKALSNVTSWDTGATSNIYSTGGLSVDWNMVGLRWRGAKLYGSYSLTGAVASSSSSRCPFRASGYQPSLRISASTTWISW